MSAQLQALVAIAARTVPGLDGHVAAPARPAWHAGQGLQAVQRLLMARHPEAGAHHAALRGWGLLVWQPAYLAVIATHLGQVQPDLDRVSVDVEDGEVGGYVIAPHTPLEADEGARLCAGAGQLTEGIARLLPAWQAHAPLHDKAARRTCADCALAAVLAVARQRSWPLAYTDRVGARWLEALGLRGEGGYVTYRKPCGGHALALDRKVCCLHFRRRDGVRCATCPGRTLRERIACPGRER